MRYDVERFATKSYMHIPFFALNYNFSSFSQKKKLYWGKGFKSTSTQCQIQEEKL